MSEIDQQFVDYVIKSIVSNPDKVEIKRTVDERGVLLELSVDPEDLGRVIGKRGATAQSLRTLLRALGTKNEARYNLKIIDTGYPEGKGPHADGEQSRASDQAPAVSAPATTATAADEPVEDVIVETPAEKPVDEEVIAEAPPQDEVPEPAEIPAPEEPSSEDGDDLTSKTRRELAELDDLDV